MTDLTKLTTLAEIRSHGPCEGGFDKIRDHFGVSAHEAKTHDEPFPVSLLLETNGLDDALWVTAHVAPDALTRFLIARLDTGEHSALKTLQGLDGDHSRQIKTAEAVVALLRRKLAGEDMKGELYAAAAARAAGAAGATADAAGAAGATADAAAARAAGAAARAAAYAAAAAAAYAYADAAARAAYAGAAARAAARAAYAGAAARAAARDDLRAALQTEREAA